MKVCTKCKQTKPETEFFQHSETRDGFASWCKTCVIFGNKIRRQTRKASSLCVRCGAPRYKSLALCYDCGLRHRLRHIFKIDTPEFLKAEAAYKQFDGRCQCCGHSDSRSKNEWSIDHDHETKKFRGIICSSCNLMLGHAGDDIQRLQAGVTYLSEAGK